MGYGGKLRFSWRNGGFFEKWGFRGFLIKKSGKIRKEPGIWVFPENREK